MEDERVALAERDGVAVGEPAIDGGDLALLGRVVQGQTSSCFLTTMRARVRSGTLSMDAMLEVIQTWRASGTTAALAASALLVELDPEDDNEDT